MLLLNLLPYYNFLINWNLIFDLGKFNLIEKKLKKNTIISKYLPISFC